MKAKIYLSGPLFSLAEIEWASKIKVSLESQLEAEVVWPHEIASASPKEIFENNLRALMGCDLMVAILDGPQVDDGSAWEMGYFYALGKRILGIRTDFRPAGETPGSKVNAMIEHSCLSIVESLEQLIQELKRILD
ncbi:MAG: nucleoside 2-deoxyribosyltransferase [Methanotrichaceae archaeon]